MKSILLSSNVSTFILRVTALIFLIEIRNRNCEAFPIPFSEQDLVAAPDLVPFDEEGWTRVGDLLFRNDERSGMKNESYRWPDGIVPYNFYPGHFTEEQQDLIVSIMAHISKYTCVRFVSNENLNYTDYVLIINLPNYGYFSNVGDLHNGAQYMQVQTDQNTMYVTNPGYLYSGSVAHELIHTLGFYHEHQREDRDNYIWLDWNNMQNNTGNQINFALGSELGWVQETFGIPYNYQSLMQYPSTAFTTNWKNTMNPVTNLTEGIPFPMVGDVDIKGVPILGQTSYLSEGDILMIQAMYKGICPDTGEENMEALTTNDITPNQRLIFPQPKSAIVMPQIPVPTVLPFQTTTNVNSNSTDGAAPQATTSPLDYIWGVIWNNWPKF